MRIRGASVNDFKTIEAFYKQENFKFDVKHCEQLLVVEDEHGIVGVGVLTCGLEASFLVDKNRSRKSRVLALTSLLSQCNNEVHALGYDNYCVYATNETIIQILKRKFGFVKTAAKQVLIKGVFNG